MEWNEPARLGYSDCAAMIKIKRVMKPDSPNLLLEVANHLVFPQDENRGAEFVQQLIETLKTSPESVNFVVAMDGEELVGFLVAVNTSEDCVLLSQAWSKPGNSWKIIDELFLRHARAPLALWLEADGGLEHFERCRVGRGIGAARLAEYAVHFRHCLDEPVGLLEQHRRLRRRNPRQR